MAAGAATGVMNSLLGKLTKLLGEEYKKLTGVRKQASFLKVELSAMKALLDRMELMDKLDPSAKNWRDHVREMSYDMENCIDDFMREIECTQSEAGFVRNMAKRLRRLGRRHEIANRMKELKVLVVEANARRERYKIDECIDSSAGIVVVDPRISAMYKEAAGLVAIDGPREQIASLLMDSHKKLRVVSIVGFGGLGKTTLAKQVYDGIGGQFSCKAFVSVSQRPDLKSLLSSLKSKIGMEDSSHAHELQDIIDRLREHLKDKRYFIVVDDLWDQPAWNIISCAFPENGNGSRVIVTTRSYQIALWSCHNDHECIYRMKPLGEEDSRILFLNRVFGPEIVCPPQFKEISAEILKKCGGLPLAIISIASLLASREPRSLNDWESVKNSLGAKFASEPTLEEMRDILNLSYLHLPVHLRPCLLYLGMYPEDDIVYRDDLTKQWIAEGFICSLPGVDLDDVAESYFNELINRSLVQPEETFGGEVVSCRVHDMMLDLILRKCTEDNFIRVAYDCEDMERLHSSQYKVRRLSLKSGPGAEGGISETLATSLSQIRSYARFGDSKYTLPLSEFKYLRVLILEFLFDWDTTVDLTAVGNFFLLRYLSVFTLGNYGVALPTKIEGLALLETLDLSSVLTQSLPSDITRLAKLVHLELPDGTMLPEGIHNMKSVRTLRCTGILKGSLEEIKGLGELTNLKHLTLQTADDQFLTVEEVDALVSSIGMLHGLKDLSLDCSSDCDKYESKLDSLPDLPSHLESLELHSWTFSRVPKLIGGLHRLQIISLSVLHLSSDDVRLLGELPSIIDATLDVSDISQGVVVISTGLFPVLEEVYFRANEDVSAYLSFEAGAMPKLKELTLGFGWEGWRGDTPVGMEHLPCLQTIRVILRDTQTESSKNREGVLDDIESAFESAARVHPRHPSVRTEYRC
ncbi:hypothetical protein ZWY2020_027259 [Hordeum vulgare]|nr:hypothetical protein ZWY2020_027259 [Hordeum vulgare]